MRRFILVIALLLSTGFALASTPALLEGRWLLVSQTYESGERQLGLSDEPVLLNVAREGARLGSTLTFEGRVAPWPAYPSPEGFARLGPEVTVRYDEDGRGLHASYVVLPQEGNATRLEVQEDYRLDQVGRLVGTMRVSLFAGERQGGGFTWHRVFEREE